MQPQTKEQKPNLEIRFLPQKNVMELTMQLQFIFETEIMRADGIRKERKAAAASM